MSFSKVLSHSKIVILSLFFGLIACASNDSENNIDVSESRFTTTQNIHTNMGPVYSISCSPTENVFAAAGYGVVQIWDTESGQLLHSLPYYVNTHVWCVSWSPDGEKILATGRYTDALIWETTNYNIIDTLESDGAFAARWSPDSELIAVGQVDGSVSVWNASTHNVQFTTEPVTGNVPLIIDLNWSPNSRNIVAAYWSGVMRVLDVTNETFKSTISDYTTSRADANGLLWLDNTRFISAHQDRTARVWNADSGELIELVTGALGWLRGLALSTHNQFIAISCEDRIVRIYDSESYSFITELSGHQNPVWSVAFSRNGNYLISGCGGYESVSGGAVIIREIN